LDRVVKYFNNKFDSLKVNDNNIIEIYSSISEEDNSVKYGVGIYNRSESAVLHLKGKDVVEFLQRISTNDISKLESYHYVTTLFTNEKGRLLDRTVLVRIEENYFLVGSKNNDSALERWINRYVITEDVQTDNKTGEYLILDIIGPQAESYLTLICGKDVDDLDNNKLHEVVIDNTKSYLLKKTTSSGENLYWLISEIIYAEELFDYLLSHKSIFDLSMVGESAFDYYRVINKVPKYPNEINDNFNPLEAGLISEISFAKGCYIGQEVVARLNTYDKVQKNLKKIRLDNIENFETPVIFYKSDEPLAILTTITKALENNHHEGLAYLFRKFKDEKEFEGVNIDGLVSDVKIKILD
jgi:folate-binding protein YgfZ